MQGFFLLDYCCRSRRRRQLPLFITRHIPSVLIHLIVGHQAHLDADGPQLLHKEFKGIWNANDAQGLSSGVGSDQVDAIVVDKLDGTVHGRTEKHVA